MARKKVPSEGPDTELVYVRTGLAGHGDDIAKLTSGVKALGALLPARASVGQLLAFLEIADAGQAGRPITVNDLKERVGPHASKSYTGLLEKSARDPEGLGLVYQLADKADARRKYLILTNEGIHLWAGVSKAMGAAQ